jgi:SAM-dependent methyltransferase
MGNHQHTHHAEADPSAMIEMLDLDAEVLHSYLADVMAWVDGLAADLPRRRILDVGSGTGAGALALAQRFGGADVIALDTSAQFLERLRGKADDLGVADRIRTVEADLDDAWPAIDPVDLVWASSSLHHMADPGRVLADIFATLRPGGLLVVAELDSFPRFLPDDRGPGPGLEARCQAVLREGLADELPHLGADWRPPIEQAGFTIVADRHFVIDLAPPLPAATGRYALACLRRMRSGLNGRTNADDLAALGALIDSDGPVSVLRRGDLTVRAERTVWVARR